MGPARPSGEEEITRVLRIERTAPRRGAFEEPQLTTKGYKLGDPAHGMHKHHIENAVYVQTLEEAAALISKGFSLWMISQGKRASLISPQSLRVVRTPTITIKRPSR